MPSWSFGVCRVRVMELELRRDAGVIELELELCAELELWVELELWSLSLTWCAVPVRR